MLSSYQRLVERLREGATLASAGYVLGWDQETKMPDAAAGARAEQLALLGRLAHERLIDPAIGELLAECEADADVLSDPRRAANLREIRRDYDRACRLPSDLVAELNRTGSQAMVAWKEARLRNDFDTFRPWLERQFDLARRKAECLGVPDGGELYDALLDEYEPGCTAARIEALFGPLRRDLTALIAAIAATGSDPSEVLSKVRVPLEDQEALNREVLGSIGFDERAGRLDVSTHPFATGISPGDTRITTRYREDNFVDSLGSTLHEAGHGMYEQGLPKEEHWGEPLGEAVGLGMHESQSRLWENHVGRSREFWTWAHPLAARHFRGALSGLDADTLFRAVNAVKPSLIRVESDEATYNLHVMLRFDLERAMLRGELAVADLPVAWNERVRADLGIEVPDDATGCLQDMHWATGAIAYFPTYTLGNLYAAQLWEAIARAIPALPDEISGGQFAPLLEWLRREIHVHGRRYPAEELLERVTGAPPSHQPLIRHLTAKYSTIYPLP